MTLCGSAAQPDRRRGTGTGEGVEAKAVAKTRRGYIQSCRAAARREEAKSAARDALGLVDSRVAVVLTSQQRVILEAW